MAGGSAGDWVGADRMRKHGGDFLGINADLEVWIISITSVLPRQLRPLQVQYNQSNRLCNQPENAI